MKIVFVDSGGINPGDISWESIEALGDFTHYDFTEGEKIVERIGDAEAVFIDSAVMSGEIMEKCPNLRFIGIGATGFNNVDLEAAKRLGIAVTNVPVYSTDAVAQHTFALLLSLTNMIREYGSGVVEGGWYTASDEDRLMFPLTLLKGKSIGIIGYGNIGKRVGEIAQAFGMKVNVYSKDRASAVSSDVVSMHCPLTEDNKRMVDREFIDQMKDGAFFINTARGGLVDEDALADALESGKIAGAGLDVTSEEPPRTDSRLLKANNCIVTPHIAFSPRETRSIVVETCAENLKSFIDGGRLNRLV